MYLCIYEIYINICTYTHTDTFIYIYICIYIYIHTHIHVPTCKQIRTHLLVCEWVFACVCACALCILCVYVCVLACVFAFFCVCVLVCVFASCTCVCYTYTYINYTYLLHICVYFFNLLAHKFTLRGSVGGVQPFGSGDSLIQIHTPGPLERFTRFVGLHSAPSPSLLPLPDSQASYRASNRRWL